MPQKLLIDADILVYQYSVTVEHEVDWGDDVWSLWADVKEAKELILNYLESLKEMTGVDDLVFCFSHKDNFRKSIYPNYKYNRKSKRKPVCYKPIKEWLVNNYNSAEWEGLEADDVLGILSTSNLVGENNIVVSEDKDLLTIPGLLWRNGELLIIKKEQADYNHLYQTLVGDTTDGYGGLKGVGHKRALEILKTPTWDAVLKAYLKAGYTKEEAITQARLARILRFSDWDDKKKKPILWSQK